jgi:cytochrome c
MRPTLPILCLLGGLASAQLCSPPANIPITNYCGVAQTLQVTCNVPADMMANPPNQIAAQRSANIFSWEEFFALNWPAKPGQRGVPDESRPFNDRAGARVWETWKESYEVFLPHGTKPAAWDTREGDGEKMLMRSQKIEDLGIDSTLQAASNVADPPAKLTDQKGRLVRYEIRMNRVMFEYVVDHKLYNGLKQAEAGTIDLPNGSMLIKAAWREVEPDEEKGFYVVKAKVCDSDSHGQPVHCRSRRMALVGFHMTQRTSSAPQWIWTTFEHVDNVPGELGHEPYSFHNPKCTGPNCTPNQPTKAGTPAQLFRVLTIPRKDPVCSTPNVPADNLEVLNREVDDALRKNGSIFHNYELIDTQRTLSSPPNGPVTAFTATPVMLGNTTMESYVQATSSCMGCHATARTSDVNKFFSAHFEFQLNNAQPQPPLTAILTLPTEPKKHWETDHWKEIQHGRRLVEETYEKLPANVPTAKLHCTSCHLNGGANSTAAWWVDMAYKYKNEPELEARINQCFVRSMNGNALCTSNPDAQPPNQGDCKDNKDIHAIMKYMDFLTKVYEDAKYKAPMQHGFPPMGNETVQTGSYCRGESTFNQKCAVCHQLDGLGRYQHDKYFRPALWGSHSFNASAGMFATPQDLAQFLRWNMPLGAGGLLSDQEAWDLETFIHGHARPNYDPPGPPPVCGK